MNLAFFNALSRHPEKPEPRFWGPNSQTKNYYETYPRMNGKLRNAFRNRSLNQISKQNLLTLISWLVCRHLSELFPFFSAFLLSFLFWCARWLKRDPSVTPHTIFLDPPFARPMRSQAAAAQRHSVAEQSKWNLRGQGSRVKD